MGRLKVIDGGKAEINTQLYEWSGFNVWSTIVKKDESMALAVISAISFAEKANEQGYTLAHHAVSNWDSAALALLNKYEKAKAQASIEKNNITVIKIANLRDANKVSVKDMAERRLRTPLFLRSN